MTKEDLNKEFGKTKINRKIFEDMPYPICTENITDEQMSELAHYVESEVRNKYPDVADRMFDIFVKNPINEDESYFIYNECDEANILYWNLLEVYAISVLGAKYYEDMNMENKLNNMENDVMTKKFGASGINREMFNDCFNIVIDMSNVSDESMQNLADAAEDYLRKKYGNDADKMFELWSNDDFTDYNSIIIATEYRNIWEEYWDVLEDLAPKFGGIVSNNSESAYSTALC